jgi:hypothetical protein
VQLGDVDLGAEIFRLEGFGLGATAGELERFADETAADLQC